MVERGGRWWVRGDEWWERGDGWWKVVMDGEEG